MLKRFTLDLDEGRVRPAIQVSTYDDIVPALEVLGLYTSSPVLVIIGGASKLKENDYARLQSLFVEVLAPLAQALNMTVVDGGTDAGLMKLIGEARQTVGATFPLLGIAPTGLADFPSTPFPLADDNCALEPNHTHFILVPGQEWGCESPWMAKAATIIAKDQPSIAVLANGGEVTWKDALQNVKAHRPVIVVSGSGRTADVLSHALNGDITDDRARELLKSNLLRSIDMSEDFQSISQTLHQILGV
ncbi:MAG: hypothetical protein VKL39_12390 [Leptolyngbyaceae bacterium]|nr:hypothetical protein [Leptolyngbyaceae bacterium]